MLSPVRWSSSSVSGMTASLCTVFFIVCFFGLEYYLNNIPLISHHNYQFQPSHSHLSPKLPISDEISSQQSQPSIEQPSWLSYILHYRGHQYDAHSYMLELSAALVAKERLLIEKEEKYATALSQLNERDLKLNYIDRQLLKVQNLVTMYRSQFAILKQEFIELEHKYNQTLNEFNAYRLQQSSASASSIDGKHSHLQWESAMRNKYLSKDSNDDDLHSNWIELHQIDALLNETRHRIGKEMFQNADIQHVVRIDSHSDKKKSGKASNDNPNKDESVVEISEKSKNESSHSDKNVLLIDRHQNEYILAKSKNSESSNIDFRLISDLGIVMVAAAIGGVIASMLGQPVLLGYLLGGSFVGPGGLRLIHQFVQVETLAHFGSIFLLFSVGIEFSLSKLRRVFDYALSSVLLCMVTLVVSNYIWFLCFYSEFTLTNVFVFTVSATMSSTTVVLKTLTAPNNDTHNSDDNESTSPTTLITVGILIFQDVTFSLFMALMSSVSSLTTASTDNESSLSMWDVLSNLSSIFLKIGIMFTILFLLIRFLPIILKYFKHRISMEVYILFIISLCVIFTLASEHLFASSELGAFVAGLLISASSSSTTPSTATQQSTIAQSSENKALMSDNKKIAGLEMIEDTLTHLAPIRDIFGALFFASIGMLINPMFLMSNFLRILTLVIFIGVTKSFAIFTCVFWRAKAHSQSSDNETNPDLESRNTGLNVAIALCQLGEFGFVFSSHAHSEGLISSSMHRTLLGATAVSLLMTPFVMRFALRFVHYFTTKSTHRN